MQHCENNSISMLGRSMFCSRRRRVGWFKCSCGGGRDQSRGHPMSFCFWTPGKSGGRAVGITGGGRPASPRKVQGAGPFHCAGVKLLCTRHRREMAGRETRGRAEIEQGRGEHLAYSPFNLGNTLFLSVRAWNPPNTRRWKQDRLNKNNNNS